MGTSVKGYCQTAGSERSKMIQVECLGSTHSNLLSEPWYESDDLVTRQAASDSRHWLQVRAWHDRSYIAWILLLAHGLTVKLSPCPCNHSSPAGQIAACQHVWSSNSKCNVLLAQARPRMIQNLTSRLQVSDAGSLHTDLTLSVELAFECLVHVGRGTWTIHYTSCMADMINISCMLSEVHRLHMCTTWKPCLLSHSHFGLMQYLAFSADWQQLKVTMLSQVRVACVHPQTVKAQLCITHKLNSGLLCWLLGLSVKPNSFVGHSAIVSWLPLDRQTDRQTERWQTNMQASRQPDRQMTDRQAGRQAGMQLNRQRDGRQRDDRLTGRPAGSPTGRCQIGRWQTKPIAYLAHMHAAIQSGYV